jgi:hypothetical protein
MDGLHLHRSKIDDVLDEIGFVAPAKAGVVRQDDVFCGDGKLKPT